jgi:hypothetical protein
LNVIDDLVARAQQLDEQHGTAGAEFVAAQYGCIGRMLRHGSYGADAGTRMAAALAQLAQTAGFMAYESQHDGHAQRWYLAGLRAAHAADDQGLAAGILGLMSNQAISLGKISDALQLAAAAREAAAHAPSTVRALISARSGLAYAAAGDTTAFRHERDRTLDLVTRTDQDEHPTPRWATYATPTELDAIAGRGLVTLATHIPHRKQATLAEAETLLRDRAHTDPASRPQRSALRHGTLLSLAYAHAGELDHAVAEANRSISRLNTVTSPRIVGLLNQLRDTLADQSTRSPEIRDTVANLDNRIEQTRLSGA